METYTALRSFADSWFLLFMFLFFIGVVLFVFRRGSRKVQDDTANMIFRNEDRPAPEPEKKHGSQAAGGTEDRPEASADDSKTGTDARKESETR